MQPGQNPQGPQYSQPQYGAPPFGGAPYPQQAYGAPPGFGGEVPVPFSATVLWLTGIGKLVLAILLMAAAGVVLLGAGAWASTVDTNNGWNSLGLGVAGGIGIAILCAGLAVLAVGVLDTIAGSMARKGRSLGRILGMISAGLSLFGSLGSLGITLGAMQNTESSAAGSGVGAALVLAVNLYIFVSFASNGRAFTK